MTENVDLLIEGGSASAGPPLGPSLAPIEGVEVGQIVSEINDKTSSFEGMEVPVTVEVDEETGEHTIEVGTPPAAQLIMEEIGIGSGSAEPNNDKVGELSFEQACSVARAKSSDLLGNDLRGCLKEIAGTAQSMGVRIDDTDAYDFQSQVDQGKYDDRIESEEEI
jgi:large subunit ribosomal protein L11